jgi:hypothetical protein
VNLWQIIFSDNTFNHINYILILFIVNDMKYIADAVAKVINVNYGCPKCGDKPPKDSKTLRYFEKKSSTGNKYSLECAECGHSFSAYVCYKCGRGYSTRGDFSIFQKDIGQGVKAYNCKCDNTLYVKQGNIH